MTVTVRLFAVLRERAGSDSIEVELAEGATVAEALAKLAERPELGDLLDRMPVAMAVNRDYAGPGTSLAAGDELALVPPVSGGSGDANVRARVTEEPLSLQALSSSVSRRAAGAIVSFQGTTREVARLDYEAYREMAEERIEAILRDCVDRHGLEAAAAEHRVGTCRAGRVERDRRRLGRPSRRGLRRRARGDRPDQGRGADLEARGRGHRRGRARALGRGDGTSLGSAGVHAVSDLTHLDDSGAARMVDVGGKETSERRASAEAQVRMSPETAAAVERGDGPKGDVIGTARLAGIQAAKRTGELIPLAHPLPLTFVDVEAANRRPERGWSCSAPRRARWGGRGSRWRR